MNTDDDERSGKGHEFKYDGGGLAKGGDVTLYYDGQPGGSGRVEKTQPMGYSADEACDVGSDTG